MFCKGGEMINQKWFIDQKNDHYFTGHKLLIKNWKNMYYALKTVSMKLWPFKWREKKETLFFCSKEMINQQDANNNNHH